jgi:phosphoglycerate dehydrogenase-like enzyme
VSKTTIDNDLIRAALVILRTPHIAAYLQQADLKAYEQLARATARACAEGGL